MHDRSITKADVLTLFVRGLIENLPAQYSLEQIREIAEDEVLRLRHKIVVTECERDEARGKLEYFQDLVKDAAMTKTRLSEDGRKGNPESDCAHCGSSGRTWIPPY